MMKLKPSQIVFIISALAFLFGKTEIGMALLFIGIAVLMFDFMPKKPDKEEKEEQIIKPLE